MAGVLCRVTEERMTWVICEANGSSERGGMKNHQFDIVEASAFSNREIEYPYCWVNVFGYRHVVQDTVPK